VRTLGRRQLDLKELMHIDQVLAVINNMQQST